MSDILKCPYCGGILEQSSIFNLNSYACTDLNCKGYFMTAPKDMWQELIRTRKALDVAVKAMKSAEYFRLDHCMCCGHDPQKDEVYIKLRNALEQITALEQKQKNK